MGQYYTPIVLDEDGNVDKRMSSHDFDNGLKLMEHSWLPNDFVAAFETLLTGDFPRRVVWAGDYADAEVDETGAPRTYVWHRDDGTPVTADLNLHVMARDLDPYRPDVKGLGAQANFVWYRKDGQRRKKPLITYTKDPEVVANAFPLVVPTLASHPFLINWDKKLYVDKRKTRKGRDGWRIHPLPLLTVEGNGRGGGDFHVPDPEQPDDEYPNRLAVGNQGNFDLIGSWARDHISVSPFIPVTTFDNDGEEVIWTEIDFNLTEGKFERKTRAKAVA